MIIMTDIKFATYSYIPIKNIKDEQDIRNNDNKWLQYIYTKQTLLKYVK